MGTNTEYDKAYYLKHKEQKKVYLLAHKEEKQEYDKEYNAVRSKDQTLLEQKRIHSRNRRLKNPQERIIYYQNHKEQENLRNKLYDSSPKGKVVRKAMRATRRSVPGCSKLTTETVQQVYENNILKYKTLTCELCKKPVEFGKDSLEHFTPLCRYEEFPGKDLNALDNLGVSHLDCNRKKNSRTLEEWYTMLSDKSLSTY